MKHASLETGIGGFDLAAEWMGWTNVFQCEIDEYCNKLLAQNFPNTIKHGDIKATDFSIYRGKIDVLSAGFPCQPYSTAGKRLGKADERHLWPENYRAVREIQPPWVVGENVRGLTNWNGGLVFDEVQADLEAAGYEVTPFLLPAAGVNAPHRRDRIFFVAYSASFRRERQFSSGEGVRRGEQTRGEARAGSNEAAPNSFSNGQQRASSTKNVNGEGIEEGMAEGYESDSLHGDRIAANANPDEQSTGHLQHQQPRETASSNGRVITSNTQGISEREQANQTNAIPDSGKTRSIIGSSGKSPTDTASSRRKQVDREGNPEQPYQNGPPGNWENFPTEPGICRGDDGIPNRVHRLKGLGNAVVPQVVLQIFKAIQTYEDLKK